MRRLQALASGSLQADSIHDIYMIGVTSVSEGRLTYWRQHDRLVTTNEGRYRS